MRGKSPRSSCLGLRGFTLIEVLVIVVIVGITLSLVVVNFGRDDKRVLADEAQRLALLLEHAHDEAVASSNQLSWAADAQGYRFAVATGPDTWTMLTTDEIFRPREWTNGVNFGGVRTMQNATSPVWTPRLDFSPSGFNAPFELQLALGNRFAVIAGDPLGRIVIKYAEAAPGAYRFGS
jgi:general secretion pathway protein H